MKPLNDLRISGVGVYLPPKQKASEAIEIGIYDEKSYLVDGIDAVGVEQVLMPADMAAIAACNAISMAGVTPTQVSYLMHSYLECQGPDFWDAAPRVALKSIGRHVPALDVRQSCNGAMGSMWLAATRGEENATIITTADRFERPYINRWRGDQSIFGDGAAAAVIEQGHGFARIDSIITVAENLLEGECFSYPGEDLDKFINFEKRREYFYSKGVDMFKHYNILQNMMQECINASLVEAEVELSEIRWFLPVISTKTRMKIQLEQFMSTDLQHSSWNFGRLTGHMGAGDQLAGLWWLLNENLVQVGDRIMMIGGGTGFTLTIAILTLLDTPKVVNNHDK